MSVSFYSTKRNSNVSIPKDKVCGYRIKNPIMKHGYSDGLRAGRNNGVVNQSLSRFSTEAERQCASSICEGNTNWLNHKVKFNKPESADNQFSIKRQAFKAGEVDNSQVNADPIPKNQRNGLGNKYISRNNFLSPPIKPRFTKDFDALEVLPISELGKPEAVTDNGLGYFTLVKVPDPTDFKWIEEKKRLQAELTLRFANAGFSDAEIPAMVARELEINKPLGREQRTINKNIDNISAETRLNTKQKLKEIIQEIKEGRAEGEASRLAISGQLIQVLSDTKAINELTTVQLTGLGESLARLGIPRNYKQLGIVPRYVDGDFYASNAGLINLLLFSRVKDELIPGQYDYDKIVKNFRVNPTGLPAIKLTSMINSLRRVTRSMKVVGSNILDLERGGVMSLDQLRASGVDLDGPDVSILPKVR